MCFLLNTFNHSCHVRNVIGVISVLNFSQVNLVLIAICVRVNLVLQFRITFLPQDLDRREKRFCPSILLL